jgi:hypothetical protein
MKKYLLLSVMLLANLTGCVEQKTPSAPPSLPAPHYEEGSIAAEDIKIRVAIVQAVQAMPSMEFPGALALLGASRGMPRMERLTYIAGCENAPCSVLTATVAEQRGEEGNSTVGNGGAGIAQAGATGAEGQTPEPSGPRPPADQRGPEVQKGKLPGRLPE